MKSSLEQQLREARAESQRLRRERDELFELVRAFIESKSARENVDAYNALAARVDGKRRAKAAR